MAKKKFSSISAEMRYHFFEKSLKIGEIARLMDKRYQHVYNTVQRENLKREKLERAKKSEARKNRKKQKSEVIKT